MRRRGTESERRKNPDKADRAADQDCTTAAACKRSRLQKRQLTTPLHLEIRCAPNSDGLILQGRTARPRERRIGKSHRRAVTAHPYQKTKTGLGMVLPSYNTDSVESNERRVWRIVAHSPLHSLWHLEGATIKQVAQRTWKSLQADRVFGRAAELGFYFFFALFPALFCAASILGMVARSAHQIYTNLLGYLALVVPTSALGTVLHTFNQTTAAASSGKITFSLLGAIWSASVGISAIQDTLNDVYKIEDTRSYLGARFKAIALTFLVTVMVTISLSSMFGAGFVARYVEGIVSGHTATLIAGIGIQVAAWIVATLLLILVFAVIYYWAPDWRRRRWRWLTPGSLIGIAGWLIASIALRIYLNYFNNYAVTYGSLGAVIILLTWFYITGLMLLVGGEINSEIEAAAVRNRLAAYRNKARKPDQAA